MPPEAQSDLRPSGIALAEREFERPPRMIHVMDKLDPEYPNRGLCGRRIVRVVPGSELAQKPVDCVVCIELNKTHDWTGPWKP